MKTIYVLTEVLVGIAQPCTHPSMSTLLKKRSKRFLIINVFLHGAVKAENPPLLQPTRRVVTVPCGDLGSLLWVSHTQAEVTIVGHWGWMGWRKATVGKGTDWTWVMEESDREFGTPAWLPPLKPEGILHRGNGEGDTSSPEEPGTLGGLRDCSGVDEDLGRSCRKEEKKEQDSGRGMVPIPLSNVRILQPKPAAQEEQLKLLRAVGERGSTAGTKQQGNHG